MARLIRIAAIALCLGLPSARLAAAQGPATPAADPASALQAGMDEGATAAEATGTLVWTAAGFAGGLGLGLIGTGLTYALAGSSGTAIPATLASKMAKRESDYQLGFQKAYTQTLAARRKRSALVGGLSGTALVVVSYVAYVASVR